MTLELPVDSSLFWRADHAATDGMAPTKIRVEAR
jgi:hypothetical protein